ncbi:MULTISPECIES: chalcone isomerase family protein [unclassified Agarivorans]|uniref:chalcone isomerase family protein n=1 Tax=unclassified Agarivorans TaxID=2636026 RepID=UPI003D7D1E79
MSNSIEHLKLVGNAQLKVLFWPIYNVSLYSADGRYQADRYPLLLSIEYLRDIERQALLDATEEQWQKLGVCQQAPCQQWLSKLANIWPNLRQGDQLRLVADSADSGRFYLNGQLIGHLEALRFSQYFLDIWLSEQSHFPKQQRQLVGAN